jgi:preprotein translocase subunit SecG
VKVFGIIAVVVVVLFVVLLLTGRGHGPGRHTSSAGVTAHDEQPRRP